jgi:class 3 adenylate cyclase
VIKNQTFFAKTMALKDDIQAEVKKIFASAWSTREGTVVPESSDIALGNSGVNIEATVLYADLDGSTDLVNSHTAQFAAEVYKTYLYTAAKIIRSESGVITAYDGDRIMAVFIDDNKDTRAVRAGLKLNYAVSQIINPEMKAICKTTTYEVKQVVGIDVCKLLVARTKRFERLSLGW